MGFTDKNVVVPEWGALCQEVQKEWQEVRSCRNLLDLGESLLKHSELWSSIESAMEFFRGNVLIRTNRRMRTQQCLDWEAMRAQERKELGCPQSTHQVLDADWTPSHSRGFAVCDADTAEWCLCLVVLMGMQAEWGWALEETWGLWVSPGGICDPGANEFVTKRPMQWFSTLGVHWCLSPPPQRFCCNLSGLGIVKLPQVILILGS